MDYEIGAVVEGRVTGITKFGVFVALPNGKSGMVHISEVASTFVKEIRDYVTENQQIKVKVVSVDEAGRISLSMKRVVAPAPQQQTQRRERAAAPAGVGPGRPPAQFEWGQRKAADSLSFEDKLSRFKQDSDEKMLDLKRIVDSKRGAVHKRAGSKH